MKSPELIDIAALSVPFDGDNPAGTDIREDASPTSPYQMIKGERQAARAAERNSVFSENNDEADQHWRRIIELAPELFTDHAKDLEIAAWYTEALVRCYGFEGLNAGFALIQTFIEEFWDHLFPQPDEDGIATRVAALAGLNGEGSEGVLIAPLRNIPITEAIPPGPFCIWHYLQARDIEKISDEDARAEKAAKAGFTLDDINQAVNGSSESFYAALRDNMQSCIERFRLISDLLTEHCGLHEAPPTSNIVNTLEESLSTVNHIAGHRFPADSAEEPEPAAQGNDETGAAPSTPARAAPAGPVQNREQAFKQLRSIARFFRETEPHSPISYVLEKAVKWGDMSLDELVSELIPDSASREHFSMLTGVRPADDSE